MTKFEVSFIAIAAFCLGFVASEYRGLVHDTQKNSASIRDGGTQNYGTQSYGTQSYVKALAIPNHDVDRSMDDQSQVFSWRNIEQLIKSGRYDDALHHLKKYQLESDEQAAIWLTLAHIYYQTGRKELLLEAWFHYLEEEFDTEKSDSVVKAMKAYLAKRFESPNASGGEKLWLANQLTALSDYRTNDGELHWMLASLYIDLEDAYQAQYHALMAANDPSVKRQAEEILAQLNGDDVSGEHVLSLISYGNQYLVQVEIEGFPARLLLDTGASLSGVSDAYISNNPSIVKNQKNIKLNTASGQVDSFLFTVDDLYMGELPFRNHILAKLPMGDNGEFDGLLGVDILGRFDFVIDQDKLKLHLNPR